MPLRFARALAVQVAVASAFLGVAGTVANSFALSRVGIAIAVFALAGYAAQRLRGDAKVATWALVVALASFGVAAALGLLGYVAITVAVAYGLPFPYLPCSTCTILPATVLNGFQWGTVLIAVAGAGLLVSAIAWPGQRPSRATLAGAAGVGVGLPVLILAVASPRDPWPAVPSLVAAAVVLAAAVVYLQRSATVAAGVALLAVPSLFAMVPAAGFAARAAVYEAIAATGARYSRDGPPTSSNTITPTLVSHPVMPTLIVAVVTVLQIAAVLLVTAGITRRTAVRP
jgi:hypothetical protein